MAASSTPSTVIEGELIIEIYPRGFDWWRGTADQLKAEGLIPEDLEWPTGSRERTWEDACFEYWLFRCRRNGKRSQSLGDIDFWSLRRNRLGEGRNGWARAHVHEKRREFEEALWRQTPEYDAHFARYWAAHRDKTFQAFKGVLAPQIKKRGGPRKSVPAESGAEGGAR